MGGAYSGTIEGSSSIPCRAFRTVWSNSLQPAPLTAETRCTGFPMASESSAARASAVSSGNLTREMGYRVARKHAAKLKTIAVLAGAGMPLLALFLIFAIPFSPVTAGGILIFGFLAHILGVLVERWLFFAEAKHTMMLYYGAAAA